MEATTINISSNCHASDVMCQLDQLRMNKQHCDFTIRCGRKEIEVHKCVIVSNSDYFRAMLSHSTKEKQNNVVEMIDVDVLCLEKCVEFMYTGDVNVSTEQLENMIHVSRLLQLRKLYEEVVTYMATHLDIGVYSSTLRIASFYGFKDLVKACDEFAIDNFHEIMKKDWFKDLEAQYVLDLLSSGDLNLLDVIKCKAIMLWIDNNSDRAEWLFKFLKTIDLNNIHPSYRRFLLDEPIVFTSPKCLKYITDSMPEENCVKGVEYAGDCNPSIIIINEETHRVERYDLQKRLWIGMHPLTEEFSSCRTSVLLVNQHLYLYYWERYLLRIDITDIEATWERLNTPLERYGGTLVHSNGMIYVCDVSFINRQLAKYDIRKDTWFQLPPKKSETFGSCIAVFHGTIYIISGSVYSEETDWHEDITDVECFNPEQSSWSSPVGKLNMPRFKAAACTYRNAIYVLGGHGSSDFLGSMEILNYGSKCWELLNLNLHNLRRISFLCHSLCGKMYLVGIGQDQSFHELDTIAVFDPHSYSLTPGFPSPLDGSEDTYISASVVI